MLPSCCTPRQKHGAHALGTDFVENVYPIHTLDQPTESQPLVTWVMCFNDVLDAERLHTSLGELLEIGDWRKLAARLRIKGDGLFEAYVPKTFNAENPACLFLHDKYFDHFIQSHSVGKYYTIPGPRAFTQAQPPKGRSPLCHPKLPLSVKDLIDRNLPQLVLHVLSFYDATVVTLSWPRNTMDDASFKRFLQNWSHVLAGQGGDIALVIDCKIDVLQDLVLKASEKNTLAEFRQERATWPGSMISAWFRRQTQAPLQARIVYIPEFIFEKLLSEARDDDLSSSQETDDDPRHEADAEQTLTDAEIILAWLSKLQGQGHGKDKARAVVAGKMVNLRHHVAPLSSTFGEYLQTLTFPIYSRLSPQDIDKPLGSIALLHRYNIEDQTSEDQLLALTKSLMERKRALKEATAVPGDSSASRLSYHDISSLDLFCAVDFSPAVYHRGDFDKPRYNGPGTVTAIYSTEIDASATGSVCRVMGRDTAGHFWMYCQLEPKVWVRLEEELYRLQKEFNSPVSGTSMRFPNVSGIPMAM